MTRRSIFIAGGVAIVGMVVVIALFALLSGGQSESTFDQAPLEANEFYGTVTAVVGDEGRSVAQVLTNSPAPTLTPSETSLPSPTPSSDTSTGSETIRVTVTPRPGRGTEAVVVLPTSESMSLTTTALAVVIPPAGDDPTPTFEPQAVPTPIGDGTFLVYAPPEAEQGTTVLIELELDIENVLIEDSAGEAPPDDTEFEDPPRATFTPVAVVGFERSPVQGVGENRVPVYPMMGASLTCPPQSFEGCEAGVFIREIDPERGQENWLWLISPREGVTGNQPMFIEVYRVIGFENGEPILRPHAGPYRFQMSVIAPSTTNALLPAFLSLIAVFALAIPGVVVWRNRQSTPPTTKPLTVNGKKPYIFISYRRGASWSLARSLANSLEERGAEVFLDVDDINEGRFADILENAIKRCDYFVPILAPETLDSMWCRREIAFALEQKKTIIPLLSEGYAFDAGTVPAEIKDIASHNAITVLPEFYEAAVDRLARRFMKLDE